MEAANFRYQCALAPRNDETFQNPEAVTLSVALTPGLRAGDEVQFSVDGNTVPNVDNPTSATLTHAGPRHAYRVGARHGSLRQVGLRCQHHVSRAAHRPEFSAAAPAAATRTAASHAELSSAARLAAPRPCLAGGLHGR